LHPEIVKISNQAPEASLITYAAEKIRAGEVLGIPTDTFYGLAVDPFNLHAVDRVYEIKTRSRHKPLSLLIESVDQAADMAGLVPEIFYLLARRFWPGPLTIIVPASAKLPLKVTGNTGRLAMRQSRSTVANQLIAMLNHPLISTSANISGNPTCRSGIEVFGTMDGRVDLVLDGGACIGEGATTVDITEPMWKVIRAGAIEEKEIAECLG
jgi:L-threonylcarbamoyladenylate synthase